MSNDLDTTVGLFIEAGRAIRQQIEQSKAPLSPAQQDALRLVHDAHSPSMREVAKGLRVAAPSATTLMNELVRKGLVRRTPNPADRREVRLSITQKGTKTLQQSIALRKKALRGVLAELSERDHKDLQRIFQNIITTH